MFSGASAETASSRAAVTSVPRPPFGHSGAAAAKGFATGAPTRVSVLRSVWWNGSGFPGIKRMVSCSYDQVPFALTVTLMRYSTVLNANSRNGFEQMP